MILSTGLILVFGVFEKIVTDGLTMEEIINQNLYDEWYFKYPTQFIEQNI
ncbi:hypothetical protein QFZ28_000152 [Neobacillus niacini]|nr:hypothetical protein [Neobacillus niacini]MDQ0999752.1 hypothetical protein [Neobacillus niacini]